MVASMVCAWAFVITVAMGGYIVFAHGAPAALIYTLAACACSAGYLFGVQIGEGTSLDDDEMGRP